ncbi:ribosome-associated protein [Brachymonas denitrificans DSM 15123]|uniref:Ribosomal silencing factor RsfS n=2 Tax=Brachymonas denitrificans TaxID=28220 RepID=A0A1H8E132_9BURK|nr:ribosome-associated protein [Brachymonas denitrificans DSM 15123]
MATEKPSAKTSTKKPPAAARAQAGTLPVEMSITDDSPAAGKMIQKLQRAIVDGLEDVKAQNIQVFNTAHMSPLFERVVIASGTSNRQTKALAASVRDAVRDAGFNKPRMEGEENGEWIIVDCGSAVVHIMQPAIRQYYTLEDIWGEKPVRLRMGAPAAKAAAEKKVSRTAARTAAKKEAAAAAAEEAGVAEEGVTSAAEAAAKPVRKTAAKAPAAAKAPVGEAKATSRAKPAATRTAASKTTAAKPAAARKPAAASEAAPARKPAVRKTAAKPATDAAATDKPAKPRARKTPVVTVVVGKTVSKKAVKARS